jgi:hypothetical protein
VPRAFERIYSHNNCRGVSKVCDDDLKGKSKYRDENGEDKRWHFDDDFMIFISIP